MRNLFLFLVWAGMLAFILSACCGCHTTHHTTSTSSDTLVTIRHVSVPYDTTVHIAGHTISFVKQVMIHAGIAQMKDTAVKVGGVTASVGITNGVIHVSAMVDDTAVRVKGHATALVADTTIKIKTTVIITKELSWWGKVVKTIKDSIVLIIIIVAGAICLYIFKPFIIRKK